MPRGVANKREAILRAAIRCFAQRHYFDVTVPDVARSAGVGEGTIYNYFVNKQDLAAAAFAHILVDIEREVVAMLPGDADPGEQLQIVAAVLFARAADDANEITYGLLMRHRDFLPPPALAQVDSFYEVVDMIMLRGRQRNTIRSASVRMLTMLWFGVIRAGLELHLSGHPVDSDLIGAIAWETVAMPRPVGV